jgi:hypothetical protein
MEERGSGIPIGSADSADAAREKRFQRSPESHHRLQFIAAGKDSDEMDFIHPVFADVGQNRLVAGAKTLCARSHFSDKRMKWRLNHAWGM